MDTLELKRKIRKDIKALKASVIPSNGAEFSLEIMKRVLEADEVKNASTVLLYYSLPDEVATVQLIHALSNRTGGSKRVILPVVSGDDLLLKEFVPELLSDGYCNIMEPVGEVCVNPEEIDVAIIPGVAFDRKCNRLGRGKGFYDRLLPKLRCRTIGLGYSFQIVPEIPCEEFDRALDMVVTEKGIYRLPL